MTTAPFAPLSYTERGDIWGFDSPRYRSAFCFTEFSLSLMDVETGIGVFWIRAAEDLAYWTKAAPLRTLFHWLMAACGGHLLHAAAVGTPAGGVLICGRGGVGKSTTALACLAAGMEYVADDYLVVRLDPEPTAFRLYGAAKVEARQLAHVPQLRDLVSPAPIPEGEKAVICVGSSDSLRIAPSLPLVAALTPRFAGEADTTFRPAPRPRLVQAAAFTTMSQLPHAGRATFELIEGLMERLPCYDMLLGSDVSRVPAALAGLIAQVTDGAAGGVRQDAAATADRPFVSVIIPVHNGARFLRDAVRSILAQNYTPLEIIVVDDGSTDDLASAVRALDADVRLIWQANRGPAAARNLGIRNAAGELLAFLDVDDFWPRHGLASLAAHLTERPELDVVQGYAQLVRANDDGEIQEFVGSAAETFPDSVSTALYRRRAFELNGLFDPELRFGEDTDWFTRAREKGVAVERVEQVTLLVRRHADNMTRGKDFREIGALRVFKKALDRRRAKAIERPPEQRG
jgi:GT2 family glycosyltransferase